MPAIAGDVDLDNLVTGTLPGETQDVGDRQLFCDGQCKDKGIDGQHI